MLFGDLIDSLFSLHAFVKRSTKFSEDCSRGRFLRVRCSIEDSRKQDALLDTESRIFTSLELCTRTSVEHLLCFSLLCIRYKFGVARIRYACIEAGV